MFIGRIFHPDLKLDILAVLVQIFSREKLFKLKSRSIKYNLMNAAFNLTKCLL